MNFSFCAYLSDTPLRNGTSDFDYSDQDDSDEVDHLRKLEIVTNHIDSEDYPEQLSVDYSHDPEPILSPGRITGSPFLMNNNNHRSSEATVRNVNSTLKLQCVREVKKPGKSKFSWLIYLFAKNNNLNNGSKFFCQDAFRCKPFAYYHFYFINHTC